MGVGWGLDGGWVQHCFRTADHNGGPQICYRRFGHNETDAPEHLGSIVLSRLITLSLCFSMLFPMEGSGKDGKA